MLLESVLALWSQFLRFNSIPMNLCSVALSSCMWTQTCLMGCWFLTYFYCCGSMPSGPFHPVSFECSTSVWSFLHLWLSMGNHTYIHGSSYSFFLMSSQEAFPIAFVCFNSKFKFFFNISGQIFVPKASRQNRNYITDYMMKTYCECKEFYIWLCVCVQCVCMYYPCVPDFGLVQYCFLYVL